MALSLVSLNLEWDRHFDTVIPFLRDVAPDVLCVQELLEADIPLLTEVVGDWYGAPVILMPTPRGTMQQYNAIFSHHPLTDTVAHQYAGTEGGLATYKDDPASWGTGLEKGVLVGATVTKDAVPYRVLTTHFTWTRDGASTPEQQEHMRRVIAFLEKEGEFVFCGDLNAPRGLETFSLLAERYTDNIPPHFETSLDLSVHKARHTAYERVSKYMVDALFTSAGYRAGDVHLQFGVSDHAAIVADIEKA